MGNDGACWGKLVIEIKLFGATSVVCDGQRTVDLGGVKSRQILQVLALAHGTPVSKERLADSIWEGVLPRSYLATLESYVCVLRRQIGSRGRASVIMTTPRGYVLDPSRVRVDVDECRALLDSARGDLEHGVSLVEEALEIARDPFLASDPFAPWTAGERHVVTHELVEACVLASERSLAAGDGPLAVRLARRAADLAPLAEEAARALMRALQACDRRSESLQVFGALRTALSAELGVEPAGATCDLYLDVLGAAGPSAGGADATELRTLLTMLRRALDSTPGVRVPRGDSGLSFAAVQALAVA